ncbi:lysozyme-like protein, partial [Basidiobolus meristosporus CBS 931.73]
LITNVFEHASKTINYGFCENIGDQRGFTCGTVGFTTGTGDLYTVIEEYERRVGAETGFSRYRPELRRLATHPDCSIPDGDVSKLMAFAELWKRESCLPEFRSVQDDVADLIYYLPAVELAAEVGITSSLGKAIFY